MPSKIENDKALLEVINKAGFILEERAKEIITRTIGSGTSSLRLNATSFPLVFDADSRVRGDTSKRRVEIDGYFLTENLQAFIECKKNETAWLFAKAKDAKDVLNLLLNDQGPYVIKARIVNKKEININSSSAGIAISYKSSKPKLPTKNENLQPIHKAIMQILDNVEYFIQRDPKNIKFNMALVPIIVTNADIQLMNYSSEKIDSNGDLTEIISLETVPYVAFNFPRQLYWDINGSQIVRRTGLDRVGQDVSVYIVHISTLAQFIETMDKYISSNRVNLMGH